MTPLFYLRAGEPTTPVATKKGEKYDAAPSPKNRKHPQPLPRAERGEIYIYLQNAAPDTHLFMAFLRQFCKTRAPQRT
jgi:hypothetical protein